ncbi:MAG: hypothetical protein ABR521_07560 [Gaiellaceae bacterium]
MRIVAVAAGALALLVPGAAADERLRYRDVDAEMGYFRIPTSTDWRDGPRRATAVVAVKSDFAAAGNFVSALWASTCKDGKQTVSFARTVVVVDDPAELRVSMGSVSNTKPNPVKRVALFVNGRRAFSTDGRVVKRAIPAGRSLFKRGRNTIEIEARKGRSKGCSATGAYAELWGRYASDVAVTGGCPPKEPGRPFVTCAYTIANRGPSPVPALSFNWFIGTTRLNRSAPSGGSWPRRSRRIRGCSGRASSSGAVRAGSTASPPRASRAGCWNQESECRSRCSSPTTLRRRAASGTRSRSGGRSSPPGTTRISATTAARRFAACAVPRPAEPTLQFGSFFFGVVTLTPPMRV